LSKCPKLTKYPKRQIGIDAGTRVCSQSGVTLKQLN
jgi:hypothetical protein